ncbi:hypothetical protein PCE1_003423 [Barthelona sp. PCE]
MLGGQTERTVRQDMAGSIKIPPILVSGLYCTVPRHGVLQVVNIQVILIHGFIGAPAPNLSGCVFVTMNFDFNILASPRSCGVGLNPASGGAPMRFGSSKTVLNLLEFCFPVFFAPVPRSNLVPCRFVSVHAQ